MFAAAHISREDGNRLTTQVTRQGWLFLPALILRPPLMLLGLILGYFVFLAGIGLFNQIWLPQMRDAGASGGLGPVGFLAMLALYVIVAYGLMNASFKLSDLLPTAVLDWIGGRAGAGDDGSERTGSAAVGGISKPARPRNVRPEEPGGDVTVHAHLVHVGLEPGRREPAPRRPRRHPRLAAGRELERAPEQELAPRQRPGAPRGLRFRQRNRVERAPQVLLLVRSLRTARERQRW